MEIIYIIALLLLLFSTFTGKLKKTTVTFAIVVMVILIYGLDNQLDLYNYAIRYENVMESNSSREIGFQILIQCFKVFHIDFATFRTIMLLIGLVLIILHIKRITKDASFFMLIYMSYFIFLDGEQLRNFYALIIFVCAFKYLFQDTKSGTLKYIVLILLASTIHTSFLIYLALLIAKSKIDISKLMIKLIPIVTIIMLILARYTDVQSLILGAFGSEEDSRASYYSEASSDLAWIVPSTIYIWNILIIKYCWSLAKNKKWNYEIKKYSLKDAKIKIYKEYVPMEFVFERLYWINIVGLLFLPLCLNSLVFYRINRNLVMINLIFISSMYNKQRKIKGKTIPIFILVLILMIGYWIFDFSIYYLWENFYEVYFVERTI